MPFVLVFVVVIVESSIIGCAGVWVHAFPLPLEGIENKSMLETAKL